MPNTKQFSSSDVMKSSFEKLIEVFNGEEFKKFESTEQAIKPFDDYRKCLVKNNIVTEKDKNYSINPDFHSIIANLTDTQLQEIEQVTQSLAVAIQPGERADVKGDDFPFLKGVSLSFSEILKNSTSVSSSDETISGKHCTFGGGALAIFSRLNLIKDVDAVFIAGTRPYGSPDSSFFTDSDTKNFAQKYFADRITALSKINQEVMDDVAMIEVLKAKLLDDATKKVNGDVDTDKQIMEKAFGKVDALNFCAREDLLNKYNEISEEDRSEIIKTQKELLEKQQKNIEEGKIAENDLYKPWNELGQKLHAEKPDKEAIKTQITNLLSQQKSRLTEGDIKILSNYNNDTQNLEELKTLVSRQKHETMIEQYKKDSESAFTVSILKKQLGYQFVDYREENGVIIANFHNSGRCITFATKAELTKDKQGDLMRGTTDSNIKVCRILSDLGYHPIACVNKFDQLRQAIQGGCESFSSDPLTQNAQNPLDAKETAINMKEIATALSYYCKNLQKSVQKEGQQPSAACSIFSIFSNFNFFSCCGARR